MVSLLLSLAGALVLAVIIWLPPALGRDSGLRQVQPGLLVVAPEASGVVTLGPGRAAQLDGSGLRVTNGESLLFRTVRGGSPLSALIGHVDGRDEDRAEQTASALSNLEVTKVSITPGEVVWSGHLAGDHQRLPASITVSLEGGSVLVTGTAKGADGLVVHSALELGTVGSAPRLPEQLLRKKAWWVAPRPDDVEASYATALGTAVLIGPADAPAGVDLRRMGHTDVHVWAPSATLSVTSYRRAEQ